MSDNNGIFECLSLLTSPQTQENAAVIREALRSMDIVRTYPVGSLEYTDAHDKLQMLQVVKQNEEQNARNRRAIEGAVMQRMAERSTAIALAKGSLASDVNQLVAALVLSLNLSSTNNLNDVLTAWSPSEARKLLQTPNLKSMMIARGLDPRLADMFFASLVDREKQNETLAAVSGWFNSIGAALTPAPSLRSTSTPSKSLVARPVTSALPMKSMQVLKASPATTVRVLPQNMPLKQSPVRIPAAAAPMPVKQPRAPMPPLPSPRPAPSPMPAQQQPATTIYNAPLLSAPLQQQPMPIPQPEPQYAPAPIQQQYAPAPAPSGGGGGGGWVPPDMYDGYGSSSASSDYAQTTSALTQGPEPSAWQQYESASDMFIPEAYYYGPSTLDSGYPADDNAFAGLPSSQMGSHYSNVGISGEVRGGIGYLDHREPAYERMGGTIVDIIPNDWWDVYSADGPGGPDPHAAVLGRDMGCGCRR